MSDLIGKTINDIINGRLIDAWDNLNPAGKAACIAAGFITAAQMAVALVFGTESGQEG